MPPIAPILATPAGTRDNIQSYTRDVINGIGGSYALQISLDRSVTPEILKSNGPAFLRDWIKGAVERQQVDKPPYEYAYLDFEPHGGWLWKIASPNHPGLFDPKEDGRMLVEMLRTAKKVNSQYARDVKWGFYRFPHFPRRGGFDDRYKDSIKRVWDAVEVEHDYITINVYYANDGRTLEEKREEIERMVDWVKGSLVTEKPIMLMVWHSWRPDDEWGPYYAMVSTVAKRKGAGIWLWADVQAPVTLSVETRRLLKFAPVFNRINNRQLVLKPRRASFRSRFTSGYVRLRRRHFTRKSSLVGESTE